MTNKIDHCLRCSSKEDVPCITIYVRWIFVFMLPGTFATIFGCFMIWQDFNKGVANEDKYNLQWAGIVCLMVAAGLLGFGLFLSLCMIKYICLKKKKDKKRKSEKNNGIDTISDGSYA